MRFVPTLAHGVADYIVGIGMILLAFISEAEGAGFWIFILFGLFAIIYSLLTDYELGWRPVLTMPAHLALDAVFALMMLAAPFVLALPELLAGVSWVIGFMAAALVATTRMAPANGKHAG